MQKQGNLFVAMILCAAALFARPAAASSPMIARFTPAESAKTIDVQLANLQQQRTHVAIQDVQGKLWFSEYVDREDGYAKKLSLTGMPDGAYICFVQNKSGRFTQAFRLDAAALVFFEPSDASNSEAGILVHTGGVRPGIVRISAGGDQLIRLQLANVGQQNVLIRLNALGDGLAFEQKITGEKAYAQNLHLQGMATGDYFLYLKIGEASLIQHVRLSSTGLQLEEIERLDHSGQASMAATKD
jgi:hypothetical protein